MRIRKWDPVSLLLKLLYYITLGVLIVMLVYPYTSWYYNTPIFIPFGRKLNHYDVVLTKGETIRIYPLSLRKKVTYTSEDFKVAEVNNTGLVRALRTGVSIIRVRTEKGVTRCRVRVIALNHASLSLAEGESKKLRVNGKSGRVTYRSDNKAVASVSAWGRITGVGEGRTFIRAEYKGKILKCEINVHKKEP